MCGEDSQLSRVGTEFVEQVNSIIKARLDNGNDKKRISSKVVTNLIIKHNRWLEMKENIINYKRRGKKNG